MQAVPLYNWDDPGAIDWLDLLSESDDDDGANAQQQDAGQELGLPLGAGANVQGGNGQMLFGLQPAAAPPPRANALYPLLPCGQQQDAGQELGLPFGAGANVQSLLDLIAHDVGGLVLVSCGRGTKAALRLVSKPMRDQVDARIDRASSDFSGNALALAARLRSLPRPPRLARLSISSFDLTAEAAALLAHGSADAVALLRPVPALSAVLRQLEFDSASLPAASLAALLSVRWPALLSLSINGSGGRGDRFAEPGAMLLAQAAQQQRLPRLQRLELPYCHLDAPAIKQLAQASWNQLESLRIRCNSLTNYNQHSDAACASAIAALAASLGPALQQLELVGHLSTAAVAALVQHQQQLASLRHLYIAGSRSLGSDSIESIARAGWALEHLAIDLPFSADQAEATAATLAGLPSLKSLYIHVHDDSKAHIFKALASVQWRNLEVLEFSLFFSFLAFSALRAPSFPRLSKLKLAKCDEAGFRALASAGWPAAPALRELVVGHLSRPTGLDAFAEDAWPFLRVFRFRDYVCWQSELAGLRVRFPWLSDVRVCGWEER